MPTQASNVPNYRKELKRSLPAEVFAADYGNLLWLPVHTALIAGLYWLLATGYSIVWAPFATIAIGHSMGCMGFVAHDIAHGGTVRKLWLRDLLAGWGFSPLWISPLLWRKWHNSDHHNNTQIKGVDPDHLFTIEDYKHNPVLKFLYRLSPLLRNLVIFGSFTFRMTQQTMRMLIVYLRDPETDGRDKAIMLSQTLLQAGLWFGVSAWLGWPVLVWGYVVPLLVLNAMVIAYIATNHFLNPLADESDVLATSLSVTLPGPLKVLDPLHQYFGAHVAHHLFPQAAGKHARTIERKVAELWPDRFHTMPITRALKLLWDTPWVYEDNATLIDPHRGERSPTLGHGLERPKTRSQ